MNAAGLGYSTLEKGFFFAFQGKIWTPWWFSKSSKDRWVTAEDTFR